MLELEGYKEFTMRGLYGNPIFKASQENKPIREIYVMKNANNEIKFYDKVSDKLYSDEKIKNIYDFIDLYVERVMVARSYLASYILIDDNGECKPATREDYVTYWKNRIKDNFNRGVYGN